MRQHINAVRVLFSGKTEKNYRILLDFVTAAWENVGLNIIRDDWFRSYSDKLATFVLVFPLIWFTIFNIYGIIVSRDVEYLLSVLNGTSLVFVTLPKVINCVLYKKEFQVLCRQLLANSEAYKYSEAEKERHSDFVNMGTRITKVIFLSYSVAGPLISNIIPMLVSNQWQLPFVLRIPFISNNSHPGYDIHYIFSALMTIFIYYYLMGFDLLFYFMSIYIVQRLELCGNLSMEIGCRNTSAENTKLLVDAIKIHRNVIKFTNDLNNALTLTIIFQYIGTMTMITISMFILVINPAAIGYSGCLGAVFIEFFLFCHFGQMQMSKLTEISNLAYCNKWYNMPENHSTLLLYIMHTQSNVRFTAYGLFDFSYEAFTQMCKATLGYYAFLTNVVK